MTSSPCVKKSQIVPHLPYLFSPPSLKPNTCLDFEGGVRLDFRFGAHRGVVVRWRSTKHVDCHHRVLRLSAYGDVVAALATPLANLFEAVTDVMLVTLVHPARLPGLRGRGADAAAASSFTRETSTARAAVSAPPTTAAVSTATL